MTQTLSGSEGCPIVVVDVFAERPLAGNQLAVIRNAAGISDAKMQALALETNFSETTFVLEESPGRARVRIFTPAFELPFAGHPTLGTAWVLCGGTGSIVLELPVGPVEVTFEDDIGWFSPPPVQLKSPLDAALASSLIGLDAAQLDPRWPAQLAQVGPEFALIGVRDRDALGRARLNPDLHGELIGQGLGVQCVFIFCEEAHHAGGDFAARMYFESAGVREDPATGSANSAFAAYLRQHRGHMGRVVVDQGVEMNRPSRLYLDVAQKLRVGGKTHAVMHGKLSA